MLKNCFLFFLISLLQASSVFSQCAIAPAAPPCTGTEALVTDNEILNTGTTKWYYGSTATINSLTLNGGTLVVCGDLTVDKFYMDAGIVFIRPGARFVIGSGIGAGLILRGNSSIYNYGTCEVQRNLSLDNGATAAQPNRVINASSSSVFKMSNQYFVINNPHSWFVNNGAADFWGIIIDPQSAAGSVCLGYSSTTRMAVLINKVADSYTVPVGSACLNVFQYSQFYGKLTSSAGLYACLGSGHTSDAGCVLWGCQPNNWGNARVFTSCVGCGSIAILSVDFSSMAVSRNASGGHDIKWQTLSQVREGFFRLERSADGVHFSPVDSIAAIQTTQYSITDKNPLPGNNYYMMKYTNPLTGAGSSSKAVKIFSETTDGFSIYPIPFDYKFFVDYPAGLYPEKIILTDISGRNIRIRHQVKEASRQIEVEVLEPLSSDIYVVHIRTSKSSISRTVFKK